MTIDLRLDCHMHSSFSDGSQSVEEVVCAAVDKGLSAIAITDHMPLPFPTRYAMDRAQLSAYRDEIERIRTKYKDRITILKGLEIEYIPSHRQWIRDIAQMDWDLLLVSIHGIVTEEGHFMVNGRLDEFQKTLSRVFNHDIQAFCTRYFQLIREAVSTGWFDAAAHLDVIKKHNQDNCFFDEQAPWYRALILETLDTMADAGVNMEINTNGINHPAGAPYPSEWIITEALNRGIPLILGSDAHHPRFQGQYFDRFVQIRPPSAHRT